jgi:hypothetical protein
MPELDLKAVQEWMQAVVVHPKSVESAVRSKEAQRLLPEERLPSLIIPSRTLTPVERVGIYHGMYLIRMEEALESDFGGLQHLLGGRGFRKLVERYVQSFPSRSFSLNHLSDHLPEFIQRSRWLPRRKFCYDLARLELAITQVFDGEEAPALTPEQIAAVPEDAWPDARLATVPAFQLLAFRYPVNLYLESFRNGKAHPSLRPKNTFVAIYRRNYQVYRQDLAPTAFDLLSDLAQGVPLGKAVTRAARRRGRAAGENELFRWFREWVSGGIFRSVETGPPAAG